MPRACARTVVGRTLPARCTGARTRRFGRGGSGTNWLVPGRVEARREPERPVQACRRWADECTGIRARGRQGAWAWLSATRNTSRACRSPVAASSPSLPGSRSRRPTPPASARSLVAMTQARCGTGAKQGTRAVGLPKSRGPSSSTRDARRVAVHRTTSPRTERSDATRRRSSPAPRPSGAAPMDRHRGPGRREPRARAPPRRRALSSGSG
jgi:hypothetical protein